MDLYIFEKILINLSVNDLYEWKQVNHDFNHLVGVVLSKKNDTHSIWMKSHFKLRNLYKGVKKKGEIKCEFLFAPLGLIFYWVYYHVARKREFYNEVRIRDATGTYFVLWRDINCFAYHAFPQFDYDPINQIVSLWFDHQYVPIFVDLETLELNPKKLTIFSEIKEYHFKYLIFSSNNAEIKSQSIKAPQYLNECVVVPPLPVSVHSNMFCVYSFGSFELERVYHFKGYDFWIVYFRKYRRASIDESISSYRLLQYTDARFVFTSILDTDLILHPVLSGVNPPRIDFYEKNLKSNSTFLKTAFWSFLIEGNKFQVANERKLTC